MFSGRTIISLAQAADDPVTGEGVVLALVIINREMVMSQNNKNIA